MENTAFQSNKESKNFISIEKRTFIQPARSIMDYALVRKTILESKRNGQSMLKNASKHTRRRQNLEAIYISFFVTLNNR